MDFEEDVFYFYCKSENVETTTVVKDVFTDKIVEAFVDFLRGCGHFDSCIYEHMSWDDVKSIHRSTTKHP